MAGLTVQITVIVRGKVQGVYFRASTKQQADILGLIGYAINQTDGSVLISAEGNAAEVDLLLIWLKHGPPLAIVESIEKRFTSKALEKRFFIG